MLERLCGRMGWRGTRDDSEDVADVVREVAGGDGSVEARRSGESKGEGTSEVVMVEADAEVLVTER